MKICFLAGANSIHSIRWIRYFSELGHSIVWISLAPPIEQAKELIKKVTFYEISPSPLTDINGKKSYFFIPGAARKVRAILKKEKPDILHIHSVGTYGLIGALAGFQNTVMSAWGSDVLLPGFLKKCVLRWIAKKGKYFPSDGKNVTESLKSLGVPDEKITPIIFGVDTEKFKRNIPHSDTFDCTVISLRSFEPIYNIESLINAIPSVLHKYPNTKFILAGSGTSEKNILNLAHELGVSRAITFTGRVGEDMLPVLLNKSDIYVSTALSDGGLAVSTAEAMSCELPVITTNIGDNRHWIQPGKGGYLIEPSNVEELAHAIIKLIESKKDRQTFGAYNRNIVIEKRNFTVEMGKMNEIYLKAENRAQKTILAIHDIEHSSPRTPHFLYYLTDYGWDITLLTPEWETTFIKKFGLPADFDKKITIETAPYSGDTMEWIRKILYHFGLRKNESLTQQLIKKSSVNNAKKSKIASKFFHQLLYAYQTVFAFPDTARTWKKPCLKAAYKILSKKNFGVIYTSSPYVTANCIAHEVKKKTGIPWIADFRDPWSLNHDYPFIKARFYLERMYEKKILSNADAIVAACPMYARRQESLSSKKVHTVFNGFDPKKKQNETLPQKLTMIYTGTIYNGKQRPELLCEALNRIKLKYPKKNWNKEISVLFFGKPNSEINRLITKYQLDDIVQYSGELDREEILKKQNKAHVLLMFGWEDVHAKGVYTTKFFEYLGAHRPILICGGPHDEEIKQTLVDTKAGWGESTVEKIEMRLELIIDEFEKTGTVKYYGDENQIAKFSYPVLAGQLNDIIQPNLRAGKLEA